MNKVLHVVSVSGGKDSTATMLIAMERFGKENCRFVFADTGNEHEAVYEYLTYLENTLAIKIDRLKASFAEQIAAKRMFIARDVRHKRQYSRVAKTDREGNKVWINEKNTGKARMFPIPELGEDGLFNGNFSGCGPRQKIGWNGGKKIRWSNKAKRRALAALHPTGNPYLDLCMWKGRFPSRKAQFCTSELKTLPLTEYQLELIDAGHIVVSWQGIRRDESANRRDAKRFEKLNPNLYAMRPIVEWTGQQTVDFVRSRGLVLNPLYSQGMGRVGCMPCINANKGELREIGARFPDHIKKVVDWERAVQDCGKRGFATFFASTNSPVEMKGLQDRQIVERGNIYKVIEWSKTTRGGRQNDLLADIPSPACLSSYGLCEAA